MTITEFLRHFYPDDHEPIHFRVIAPRKMAVTPKAVNLCFSRHQLQHDAEVQTALRDWNKTHGIYFCVNAGGVRDDEITRINAVFCEMDEKGIQEQIDIYLNESPVTPSLLVETKKSVHAYWLLEESILPSEFVRLQKGLIKHFHSDEKICNPSRVMRLPYLNHVSVDGYKQCTLQYALGHTYTYTELASEFPFTEPPKQKFRSIRLPENDVNSELVSRIKMTPMYSEKGDYGYTRGICHDGQHDTGIFVHLRTGAVKCFKECSWHTIREAFGVEIKR